jgi:hypothetical protein
MGCSCHGAEATITFRPPSRSKRDRNLRSRHRFCRVRRCRRLDSGRRMSASKHCVSNAPTRHGPEADNEDVGWKGPDKADFARAAQVDDGDRDEDAETKPWKAARSKR